MAERASKLEWRVIPRLGKPPEATWMAEAAPASLMVEKYAAGFVWRIWCGDEDDYRGGESAELLAAQLAAEDAALSWLREGVEALDGRVLTGEQVDPAYDAVSYYIDAFECDLVVDAAQLLRKLARELGGGRG